MKKCSGKSNISIVKDYLAGVRPFTELSMHVPEKDKYRNEGETWTDTKGIKWKRIKGKAVRITKTQGDVIREAIGDGLDCGFCKMKWKWANKTDRKMLGRTGLCSDCLIDYETKLRILGIYDSYEKYRLAIYELGHLRDLRLKFIETIDYFERTDGDVNTLPESEYDEAVTWKNTNKEKIVADAKLDLQHTEELIAKGTEMTKDFKAKYLEAIEKYQIQDIVTKQ